MKHVYKIFSVVLIASLLFTLVGCSLFNRDIDNNSSVNSSDFTSSEHVSSDEETTSPDETISSENEDLSSNSGNTTADISSNVVSKPSGSTNTSSVVNKPSTNTSSTVSKPQTNTSSTSSTPSSSTSSATSKPMTWKEEMESKGYEVLFDENVGLYYYFRTGYYRYEAKYDGVNTKRDPDYSNWDSTIKMYYEIDNEDTMSWYDGGWKGATEHPLWNEKYRNGYWKLSCKVYTDGTCVLLDEWEYEEDESYDSSKPKCGNCGKLRGNGTNGTCSLMMSMFGRWRCLICNTIVEAGACHTCPDGYVSDLAGWEAAEQVK